MKVNQKLRRAANDLRHGHVRGPKSGGSILLATRDCSAIASAAVASWKLYGTGKLGACGGRKLEAYATGELEAYGGRKLEAYATGKLEACCSRKLEAYATGELEGDAANALIAHAILGTRCFPLDRSPAGHSR